MKVLIRFSFALFVLFSTNFLNSCNVDTDIESTGQGSEILVVCTDSIWNSAAGDTLRATLTQNMEGLTDAEAEFLLTHISETEFDNVRQTHRNILMLDINSAYKKNKVETLRDVWSHPQRVIKIKATSDTSLFNLFVRHSERVRELFNQSERARFKAKNNANRNKKIEKILVDEFGIKMATPEGFSPAKKSATYIYLKSGNDTNSIGLILYLYPFNDTTQLSETAVLAEHYSHVKQCWPEITKRESLLPTDGKLLVSRKILFKELYSIETRGTMITESDSLGIPFFNYTIVDAPRKRIVVFSAIINNPGKPKRDYVRQLESMIWGAEFCEPRTIRKK
jgi:hypothetical protein